jgi:hypothetical protein
MRGATFGRSALGPIAVAAALVALGGGAGCASSDGEKSAGLSCVENLDLSCAPLYTPDFDHIFTNTLHPTCAQPGVCHAADSGQAGLVYENADTAYALLLGQNAGHPRVVPGDPSCSPLIERIETSDPSYEMPPGKPLSDPEKCAFVQWVAAGAKR